MKIYLADRKSTRLNSSHANISYAVFCLKKKNRYKVSYSIIFCDVDHFKNYNDKNGHPAGDEVLKSVARILKNRVRTTDLCARYGGEEFVVLCPNTSSKQAAVLAEVLRKITESHDFPHGSKQPLVNLFFFLKIATPPDFSPFSKHIFVPS